jgi:hypothetical protein
LATFCTQAIMWLAYLGSANAIWVELNMPWLAWNVSTDAKVWRGNSLSTNELTDVGISSATKGDWQGYCHHVGTIKVTCDKTDGMVYCVTDRIILRTPSKEVSYREKDISVRSGRDNKSYSSDPELACILG